MYKHYETSDDVFVDREEHIEWMNNALERCKKEPVVLHLKGIGGIGKSSLLKHWMNTHKRTIRLDCEQYTEFYQRLNILAKGAVLQGIRLKRFDILWQIRQRFVEGVEPVREEGREWAKEVVMAIPFIGSLATIGSAITAVGAKVTPKIKGKYGTIGKWLQEQLGKHHIEELLEILWKDPRRAEFLFLSAFVEDINNRDNLDTPVIFLFDHFEHIDGEKTLWKYMKKRINESELWTIFLSNLSNCVGVIASRKPAATRKNIDMEESELLELDRDSCLEMLELQHVVDKELQDRIVGVSGGNPFIIDAICDMITTSAVSVSDIEDLRADNLAEVRLKVWRRLFSEAKGLNTLINRAGLLPYFDEEIMGIIAPEITADNWDRLRQLSFVREREDKSYVLHELAIDLVKAELGGKLKNFALNLGSLLEKASENKSDYKLLGFALSVQGLHSPHFAIEKMLQISSDLSWRYQFREGVEFHNSIRFENRIDQTLVSSLKAWHLTFLDRVAEAEHILTEELEFLEKIARIGSDNSQIYLYLMEVLQNYGVLLHRTKQPVDAQDMFERALQVSKEIDPTVDRNNQNIAFLYIWYSGFLMDMHLINKASGLLWKALELLELDSDPTITTRDRAFTLVRLAHAFLYAGKVDEAERIFKDVLETKTEDVNELNCLASLGDIYRLTSRCTEAEHTFRKGLELIQKIFEREGVHQVQPTSFHRHYALSLKLANRYADAEDHYKKALSISRKSVAETPEVYLPGLSMVLNDFAILYHEMNQHSKAGEFYREALDNYERLSKDWSISYDKYVAWALNNYSILLRQTSNETEARKYYHEALQIGRELAQKYPENIFHPHLLATVLNNLGVLRRNRGENDEAEEVLLEALEVKQELAKVTPDIFLSSLATTLNNLGVVLATAKKLQNAKVVFNRGLRIRRELVERSPEIHTARLGFVLNNLGNVCKLSDEQTKAKNFYEEALDIIENLATRAPSVYESYLKVILSNLMLYHNQRHEKEGANFMRRRLEDLGTTDIYKEEMWIEEEETEADPF
jgi:tetratricopeptide (TPR) repeat protein